MWCFMDLESQEDYSKQSELPLLSEGVPELFCMLTWM